MIRTKDFCSRQVLTEGKYKTRSNQKECASNQRTLRFVPGTDESDYSILSTLKIVRGGGGVNPEHKFVNADQTISTVAFDAIVSTETVINSVTHKQTLPSSRKVLGDFDARVLLEVNGLLPSFDPEIKRQISDNLNNFFCQWVRQLLRYKK